MVTCGRVISFSCLATDKKRGDKLEDVLGYEGRGVKVTKTSKEEGAYERCVVGGEL